MAQLWEYSIATLEEAKEWASAGNFDASKIDDAFNLFLNTATRNIEGFLRLEVLSRGVITEQHSIKNLSLFFVFLLQRPVIEFQELNEDVNRAFDVSNAFDPAEYIVNEETGKVTHISEGGSSPTPFTTGIQSLQAKYRAGYPTREDIPWNLRGGCMETAAQLYYHAQRKQFGVTSIKDEQGNRTFMKFDFIPTAVKDSIHEYRKINIGSVTGVRISAVAVVATGSISGVVDDGVNPVSGAWVNVTGGDNSIQTTKTAADGTYSFSEVPVGSYSVDASKAGIGTAQATGTITEDQSLVENLTLT